MALPVPNLDDRSFQDIVNETKTRIPRYCPEWTDHNLSDPGVTLIELFAWMVDLLLYRVNRVPDRDYIEFLNLMGVKLLPPRPAQVDITFRLTAPQPEAVTIPRGSEVATVRTETQEAIAFATERGLPILVPALVHCLVSPDQATFYDYMPALTSRALQVPIFRDSPQPDNAFYLGYHEDLSAHILALTVECNIEGVGVDPRDPPLAWECWNAEEGHWQEVDLEQDITGGLNRNGIIILHLPYEAASCELSGRHAFWLRCRVTTPRPGQPFYVASPRVNAIATESLGAMVPASHAGRILGEALGRSDGTSGQLLRLQSPPVLPRREAETLEVQMEDGTWEPWIEVQDFAGSGPDDPHFTCDSVTGEVRFGPSLRQPDGTERQYGRIPAGGSQLRFSSYRTGGGIAGNVGRGTITVLKSSIPYIATVTNRQPARGGTDAETLEAAKLRGPSVLRARHRAVTAEDYEHLAREASPQIARSRCRVPGEPSPAPDGSLPPGTVEVLLVPTLPPAQGPLLPEETHLPDRLRQAAMAYLEERRILGTTVLLGEPPYLWVSVAATLKATRRADREGLRHAAEGALYSYIHPTRGGPEGAGWPFGRPLHISELYSLLQGVSGVEYVEALDLYPVDAATGQQQAAAQRVTPPPDGLLCSHTHTVKVS